MKEKLKCKNCGCENFFIHSSVWYTSLNGGGYTVYRCAQCSELIRVETESYTPQPTTVYL